MIAGLRGRIARFGAARVYLEAGGVTYEVHVPLSVQFQLQQLPPEEEAQLIVYHHFTEGEQRLFGFLDLRQREFFIALQNLKGIGTGLALSLLSHLDGRALLETCERKDVKSLTRIPRVGKTTAETLVFEINRKRSKWEALLEADGEAPPPEGERGREEELAFQALLQLGYKDKEAEEALRRLREEIVQAEGREAAEALGAADWIARSLRIL